LILIHNFSWITYRIVQELALFLHGYLCRGPSIGLGIKGMSDDTHI